MAKRSWFLRSVTSLLFLLPSLSIAQNDDLAPQLPGTTYTGLLGAVATVHPDATQAAMQTLLDGGTAIDAAIAAALTLGVVDGFNSGIGGGLFAVVRYADGTLAAIDGREVAPLAATESLYLREGKPEKSLSRTGALAIGLPGSVLAFEAMHDAGGKIPLAVLYNRAAEIADKGFAINPHYADRLQRTAEDLSRFAASKAIFLDPVGKPWQAGHVLKQRDLASTYRRLAQEGSEWFYLGGFAQATARWMKANGGIITEQDFAQYLVKPRTPVQSEFNGYTLVSFPPPSSGGVHLAQMLTMLDMLEYTKQPRTTQRHLLAEVMKLAYADRSQWVGDPDFVDVPNWLLSSAYLKERAASIDASVANKQVVPGSPPMPSITSPAQTKAEPNPLGQVAQSNLSMLEPDYHRHTSHIAVADAKGNWVSLTTSLNTSFGSKVTIPGTGVILNNQMDDFAAQAGAANRYGLVQGAKNLIEPGKRPLSSMTPTLVLKDGEPILAIGAAGGPMIINQVLQGVSNYLLLGMGLGHALAEPRIHHQWQPDTLFVEKTLPDEARLALVDSGHVLDALKFEGSTNAVAKPRDCQGRSHCFEAVSEPRMVERTALH